MMTQELNQRNLLSQWPAMIGVVGLALLVACGIAFTPPTYTLTVSVGGVVLIASFLSTEAAIYILIFSMLLSPEILVGELGPGGWASRGMTLRTEDFLLVIIGLSWFARTALYKELGLFVKTPLNRPILYYMLASIFSTFLGVFSGRVQMLVGFFFVLKYCEYFFVYFMVANHITTKDQVKKFVLASLMACMIISLYAIFQIPQGGRATAPFEGDVAEPNTLGGYLAFMFSIVAGLFFSFPSIARKVVLGGLGGLILIALMMTYSRASYLAFIAVYGALLFFSRRRVLAVSVLSLFFIIGTFILPTGVRSRIVETFHAEESSERMRVGGVILDESVSARVKSWQEALHDWGGSPIFGYGVTGYRFLDAQYPKVLVETGLIGMAAFLFLLSQIWRRGLERYREASDPYTKGLTKGFLIGFFGLLVHASGANTFTIVRIMEPFWLFAGLVMLLPVIERKEGESL